MKINKNFKNLENNYLFATIANKTQEYVKANPDKELIRLGIGDVTMPLTPAVIKAGQEAVLEMSKAETFKGYGPYEGYGVLVDAIHNYYGDRNVPVNRDEIFVSDGAKSDVANILDIFDESNVVLVPDPVYPVYYDSNVLDGRKIILAPSNVENGFLPMPNPKQKADIIYLCSPNNPTGAVYTKAQLKEWVDYANKLGAVILFDAAYEFFVSDESLPRSIYEIEGAKTCAIEFCSFSKTAGFTGTRCGYTIVPKDLGELNALWLRRQATKFNGVSWVVQRMAAAVYSKEGIAESRANVDLYMKNANLISKTLTELNIWHTGGVNSPYIWLKCPNGDSWKFFDLLLEEANVVGTPGAGFGKCGEGFFRLTAFNNYENTKKALERITAVLKG